MSREIWTPRVGDRVRVEGCSYGFIGAVFTDDPLERFRVNGDDGHRYFVRVESCTLIKAAPPARPIAYVKQTRPDVDFDLRTPYQQRGWAP